MTLKDDDVPSKVLRKELEAALAEVSAAEQALDAVLSELRTGVRAEKVTVTAAIEDAFTRLRNSRAALAKLRELVDEV
ncbi:MAG TPA: hypothetical protein VM580_09505 [Labilithrix sp.]|nr:hypothetical protein [Labilithrix sp.]